LNSYFPDTGGIQTFCADLLPELQHRGHDVLLLTAHTRHEAPDIEVVGGLEVRRVDSVKPLLRRDPGGILRAQQQVGRVIREFEPDIVHIHPCGPELPYVARALAKRPTPTVMTLHNNYDDLAIDLGEGSFFGRALDTAGRVAAVSDDARRWLLTERPDIEQKTCTIHNGIPDRVEPPDPLPWNPPVLGFIGRVEPQKRLDVLLAAFATVVARHGRVRLRIAGDGSDMASIRSLTSSLGLDGRVDLVGMVAPDQVPRLLDATTVFVMSSDYEGLPIALLEAARHERPTVATDVGGTREAVIDGATGVLVERDEPAALADAIVGLLDDPDRATELGHNARRHFVESFGLAACADRYEQLYADTVEARG
jgi:glycosyltransferase involved in cell wall biosynthesis